MTSPAAAFRIELSKIMPGYKWTVHKALRADRLEATGIQTSGFNRLSTLSVVRTDLDGERLYTVTCAGNGTRSPWVHEHADRTLARALRGLQDHYRMVAEKYRGLDAAMQRGRVPPT